MGEITKVLSEGKYVTGAFAWAPIEDGDIIDPTRRLSAQYHVANIDSDLSSLIKNGAARGYEPTGIFSTPFDGKDTDLPGVSGHIELRRRNQKRGTPYEYYAVIISAPTQNIGQIAYLFLLHSWEAQENFPAIDPSEVKLLKVLEHSGMMEYTPGPIESEYRDDGRINLRDSTGTNIAKIVNGYSREQPFVLVPFSEFPTSR